jgi:hypothetical protein
LRFEIAGGVQVRHLPALALAYIAIGKSFTMRADRLRVEAALHVVRFLLRQFTSTQTAQHPVVLVHSFLSFLDFGAVGGPKPGPPVTSVRRKLNHLPAALADRLVAVQQVSIPIDNARRQCARAEGARHSHDFLFCQLTRSNTAEHSVVLIHLRSPFLMDSGEAAQTSGRRSYAPPRAATSAFTYVAIDRVCDFIKRANRSCPDATLDFRNFLLRQLTSAKAVEYSVVFVHGFSPVWIWNGHCKLVRHPRPEARPS